MKNAKGTHNDWRITGKKKKAHEVKTKQKRNQKVDSSRAYMTPVMQKYRMEQYVQERTRKMKVIEIKGNKTKSRIKEQQKDEEKTF